MMSRILVPTLFVASLAFLASIVARAAPVPNGSHMIFVEPLNFGHAVHGFDLINGQLTQSFVYKSDRAQVHQQVLIGAPGRPPLVAGVTYSGETLLLGPTGVTVIPEKGFAIAPWAQDFALVAGAENKLFTLDLFGAHKEVAPEKWLDPDPSKFGQITHLSVLDPVTMTILAVGRNMAVVAKLQNNGAAPQILSQARVAVTGTIVRHIAAGTQAAWFMVQDLGSFAATTKVVLLNYGAATAVSTSRNGTTPIDDVTLIGVDPADNSLLGRRGDDYVRVTLNGTQTIEEANAFYDSRLTQLGLPQTLAARHLSAIFMPWFLLHRGINPTYVVAPTAPAATTTAPVAMPTAPKPPRRAVFDPLEPEDFLELSRREAKNNKMKELPDTIDARFFAEWINATTTLRYYFKQVSAEELKTYGLRFQMDSLKVLPGKEATQIRLWWFLGSLSKGEKALRCQTVLTKP